MGEMLFHKETPWEDWKWDLFFRLPKRPAFIVCMISWDYGEGRTRREEENRGHPYDFTENGTQWGVGDRSLHSCKEFLDAFTFPSEEEMKAPVNKPMHPLSVSSSQSLRQRKAMLKHQSCTAKRKRLDLLTALCQLHVCWALLTTSRQGKGAESQ